jgi:hypothetical protein
MTDWVNTEVGFELLESQEGTIVRFFHRGWQEESEHFCISNYCWGQLLGGLKDYVETGAVIPFEKRN